MNYSLDNALSNKLGIDNHLCHPLRSISWWGLVVFDMVIVAMVWRNHSGQRFDVVALTVINVATLFMYFWLRTVVHQLATGLTNEQAGKLRSIAARSLSIAGCVAIASEIFAMR
jgi:hypothetical protein